MLEIGLYINDLSMHDSSREMVLAGTQQEAEFKIALEQVNVSFFAFIIALVNRTTESLPLGYRNYRQ